MSQSDEHRKLVTQVAEVVTHQFPHLQIIIDIQSHPGDPVPPMICGYRPDLYAANRDFIAIAEAKTTKDLKSQHTYNQVASFLSYLEQKKNGYFILSVTDCGADRAKTLLRFICQQVHVRFTSISVFDSYDLWSLELADGKSWLLN